MEIQRDYTVWRRSFRSPRGESARRGQRLRAAAAAVLWVGLGAEAMRGWVERRVSALELTAVQHDQAARAMREHAQRVALLQQQIRDIMHRLDAWLDRLSKVMPLPPPGHRDWLELPERLAGLLPEVLRDLGIDPSELPR